MDNIGTFSKICRVTPKTLRLYDEMGLLKPCHIDKFTGYRYYDSPQLVRMHKILSLKQMGFSLTEIIALLDANCAEGTLNERMQLKRRELSEKISQEQTRLMMIENFLQNGKGDFMNGYTATIKELPEVIVASLRRTIPSYDAFFELFPNVMGPEMERLGCVCAVPEYCFNIYHDGEYRDHDIDVEMCQAVTERKPDSDILKFKTVKRVPTALSVLHRGPYDTIGAAYTFAWIGYQGTDTVLQSRPGKVISTAYGIRKARPIGLQSSSSR